MLLDSVLTHEKQSELLGQIYTTEEYKVLFDQLTQGAAQKTSASSIKLEGTTAKILSYAKGSEPFKTPLKSKPKPSELPTFDDTFEKPYEATVTGWKNGGGQAEIIKLMLKLLVCVQYLMEALPG
eukprot:500940-Ditylum_brightwellii.AAC.1